jgi:hypothetical protein
MGTDDLSLKAAAASYAIAEAAVLGFAGDRKDPEYELLKQAWESATISLGKSARVAGRRSLRELGQVIAGLGRVKEKEPA